MDVTTQRRSLNAVTGGLLLAAAGAVAWSLSGINSPIESGPKKPPTATHSAVSIDEVGELADFATSLRRPLVDPKPPEPRRIEPKPVVPAVKPIPSLQLTLVGTIIQANNRLAIIADPTGKFDVKGVGESLELSPAGISIQRISSEQVELEYQGKRSTVILNKDAKPANTKRRPGKPRNRGQ